MRSTSSRPARSHRSSRPTDRTGVTGSVRRRRAGRIGRIGRIGTVVLMSGALAAVGGPTVSAEREVVPTGPVTAPARSAPVPVPRDGELGIAAQTFTLASEGVVEVRLVLPDGVDPAAFDARSVLVVTSHRAIDDRVGFQQVLDGELTRTEDTFDISLDPLIADPNLLAVEGTTITVRVPTEALTRTPQALQLGQAGVHPVVFELRLRDRAVGEVTTFVNRLPSTPPTAGDLAVAFLMTETTDPTIEPDGAVAVPAAARAELVRLAESLAAMDAAAAQVTDVTDVTDVTVPRGVLVEPSVVGSLVASDAELAADLLPGLERSVLLSAPRLPLDPSSAADAGLDATYATWLRSGEDQLRSILPVTPTDRSVHVVERSLDDRGAELVRNLGTQLLVLPYPFYDGLEGSLRGFTDISQLVTVGLADGNTVPAAIVDPYFAAQLEAGADDPVLGAVEVVAELVVLAGDIDDDGLVVDRHSVLLALPDLGVPDPALMSELTSLLLSTPGLQLVEPGDLPRITTTLLNDGRLVTVTLPAAAGPDLSSRVDRIDEISAEVLAYATMLPEGAEDVARWTAAIDAYPSSAMTDDDVDASMASIREDFTAIRTAVVPPPPFSLTLTGRESNLRFSLANTSDQELTVRVQLSSPKIRFPDGDRIEVLPPRSETDVVVRAEALSNGKSSVFLRIFTPGGEGDVQVVPEVVLTARVTSFAGIGQLITGAGLLLIVTWWANHVRRSRRSQQAERHQSRHPASRRVTASVGAPGATSPDAAAAAAPPSDHDDQDDQDDQDGHDEPADRAEPEPEPEPEPGDGGDGDDGDDTPDPTPDRREVSPDAAASSLPPS